GRVAVLPLDPLSVAEATGGASSSSIEDLLGRTFDGPEAGNDVDGAPSGIGSDLGDWLLRGGYPELAANPEVDRRIWFASYIETYLERDVRDLLQVGDLDSFTRFVFLAAARS